MKHKNKSKIDTFQTLLLTRKWPVLILLILGFVLYGNTIFHDYTQDDAIVIYDNMYTTDGFGGIPGLLQYDTFKGFFKEEGKSNLVSGGRYRPLTPVMFAMEWAIFGKNPRVGHFINVLLYALLGVFVFLLLDRILGYKKQTHIARLIAFVAALVFVAHPVHTEAVANIKGRDEIMTLLLGLGAIWFSIKSIEKKALLNHFLAGLLFFLALMSKENAITLLVVVPILFWSFLGTTIKRATIQTVPFMLGFIVFFAIRSSVVGLDLGATPMELMNNPFLKIENGAYVAFSGIERFATITFCMGKYLLLLVFPHPLTHDYYPRYIELMSFSDWEVWLSLLAHGVLLYFMIAHWRKKNIPSFAIFYYFATISIVSNIVFPIGTNMSERFLFMPSLAFALLVGVMSVKYINKRMGSQVFVGVIGLLILAMSVKTISRNMVWKDDFTLFTTDVHTSTNSAKVLNAAGGALITEAYAEKNDEKRKSMITEGIGYLKEAIRIHPNYKNAYLLLGNGHYYLDQYQDAIDYYELCLQIDPNFGDAHRNLSVALRDAGRYFGEKEQNLQKSISYLKRSNSLNPKDYETLRLLGVSHGFLGKHEEALSYFERAATAQPDLAQSYVSLYKAYANIGEKEKAEENYRKALNIDPKAFE